MHAAAHPNHTFDNAILVDQAKSRQYGFYFGNMPEQRTSSSENGKGSVTSSSLHQKPFSLPLKADQFNSSPLLDQERLAMTYRLLVSVS